MKHCRLVRKTPLHNGVQLETLRCHIKESITKAHQQQMGMKTV